MSHDFYYEIKQWNDIKEEYKDGSLLIGNGASIALHSKFHFSSLKDEAEKQNLFSEDVINLFEEFKTTDFELVLRLVWYAKLVNSHLVVTDTKTDEAYENLKDALIKIVNEVHCSYADIETHLPYLYKFTKSFRTIVSLNYDLIMYWVRMYGNAQHADDGHTNKDCFKGGEFCEDWTDWRNANPKRKIYEKEITLTFYQHGNLSIFRYPTNVVRKIKRGDDANLLDNINYYWNDQNIPLFIAEGTGKKKEESIRSNEYLSTIYYEVLPKLITEDSNLTPVTDKPNF
ncbi:hypothetical protein B9T29_12015 [Acinetobacter sp. ANC 3903]|uniref:DUF4917 family protein n=1 Tax=Acinetobacter sp. ANC 3903 TaxID=1977883 RepID=UPI000A32DA73|nr:DUF4917 family protein [Acinetobacter sp. ANC 3903]OTG59728.1 hypothetical protein B9T29_12015 [Acinetobacter sp. ANC 3903]